MQRRQGPQLDQRGMSTTDRVKQGGENGTRLLDGESRLAQATVETSLCEAVRTGVWPTSRSMICASLLSQFYNELLWWLARWPKSRLAPSD